MKLDLTKEYKQYYTAKSTPIIVEFGEIPYLTIEGKGEPAGEVFTKSALGAYLENKGKVRKNRGGERKKYHSWDVYIGLDHEDVLRSLASKIGLSISEGYVVCHQKSCYVKNPEVVGLI